MEGYIEKGSGHMKKWTVLIAFCIAISFPTVINAEGQTDCKTLQNIFGTGVTLENGRCSVEMVREELQLTHMGEKLSPQTMEVVFHFTFEQVGHGTAVMGELALLEEEVNPVIDALRNGNLEVSALHNHMISEQPRIMYIHFQGIGDLAKQAKTIKNAIEKTSHETK
jgi:hypothetical protein